MPAPAESRQTLRRQAGCSITLPSGRSPREPRFLAGVPRLWPAPLASQNENVGLYVEGTVTGPKLKGTVKGVDYANVRADGRLQLHFHAEITTEAGKKIAFFADAFLLQSRDRRWLNSG